MAAWSVMTTLCGLARNYWHLLFARNGTLFAAPFDPSRALVTGTPLEILHEVAGDLTTGAHHFAASASGTLVYISGRNAPGSTVPVWWYRDGRVDPLPLNVRLAGFGDSSLDVEIQTFVLTPIETVFFAVRENSSARARTSWSLTGTTASSGNGKTTSRRPQ